MSLVEVAEPVAVLLGARELISDPVRWARGASARDQYGRSVHPGSPDAVAWDIEGALGITDNALGITPLPLLHVLDFTAHKYFPILAPNVNLETKLSEDPVWEYVAYESIHYINDWHGHAVVLSLLDKCIAVLEEDKNAGDHHYGRYTHLFPRPAQLHRRKKTDRPKGR